MIQWIALGLASLATILVVSFALVVVVLFWKDPDKTKDMLGTLALFVHSVRKKPRKSQPVRHQRAEDPEPHVHVRAPRKSLLMTMTDFVRRNPDRHDAGHRGRQSDTREGDQ